MSDSSRGTDRLGRRAKRFLTPLQEYEIWLQLVRQETTIGEAADQWAVDRSTIMRLREVAKQGALAALAESRQGTRSKEHDLRAGGSPSWRQPAARAAPRGGRRDRGAVHQWGQVDRSHRKLAYRGSYLERVWVSPSSVRRVLAAEGLRLRPLPRPGRSVRKPFPDWVEYTPNSIWIFDTTHFTRAGVADC
jgi:hypothetical protein